MAAIYDSGFKLLPHAPYSQDLASSDFHLFPHLNKSLSGLYFRSDEEVTDAVTSFFETLETSFFLESIKALEHRWKRINEEKRLGRRCGEYVWETGLAAYSRFTTGRTHKWSSYTPGSTEINSLQFRRMSRATESTVHRLAYH
ncbi:hypothetical protein LAZ67_5004120 [Cordylochernes scorpioides]|uniref:Histone-lysine N-methyltransferase SETMAR n=1 Tax=Cordylochernes scorpioides TaxID=51811 RepID=A0ABY6KJK7_9ARAC|nr:hypothetical protein LAZ67_5004120 [Cordylochernes scorpioides]